MTLTKANSNFHPFNVAIGKLFDTTYMSNKLHTLTFTKANSDFYPFNVVIGRLFDTKVKYITRSTNWRGIRPLSTCTTLQRKIFLPTFLHFRGQFFRKKVTLVKFFTSSSSRGKKFFLQPFFNFKAEFFRKMFTIFPLNVFFLHFEEIFYFFSIGKGENFLEIFLNFTAQFSRKNFCTFFSFSFLN